MTSIVQKVLETDFKFRKVGTEGKLHYLNDMKISKWDYSLPTIVSDLNVISSLPKEEEVIKVLRDNLPNDPLDKSKMIDMKNVLLAGGAVMNAIKDAGIDSYLKVNDYDFFIYGLETEEEATKRALKFLKDFKVDTEYDVYIFPDIN
jgi:hypothetical protein